MKKLIPFIIAGAMVAPMASANSLSYGFESVDLTASGKSFTGIGYGIGVEFDLTEELSASVSYATGEVSWSTLTADVSGTTIGLKYTLEASEELDVYLGVTNTNAKVSFSAAGYSTSVSDDGTGISVGMTASLSDKADFTIDVTSIDGDTSTEAIFAYEIMDDMDLNFVLSNGDDWSAYGVTFTQHF